MLQACFIRKLGRASDRKWYENLLIFASKRNSRGLIIYNNLPCCPIDILATKDNRMSVADILNDRNYFPNPKDEETVEQYFSGIPQIKFSSGKSGQNYSDKLGSLLTSRATAEALSRHILRSYDEEAKPKEWLPLNSKSILKQWFNYTCGNMFKDEFYIYKQPRLMEHSFQSLKSMIMKLSES
ncbi:hypothetical protein H4Q26_002567 [Puccinia striiformis f. sp. tritici PST-130]|nr:hypothetical protein H4Q26_002567 [Puccinia striiformis f. sp. tritici PST-130]